MSSAPPATPSSSVMATLQAELARHPPFSQMTAEHTRRFIAAAAQTYHAPGETVLEPGDGPVQALCFVRRGAVAASAEQVVAGDLFPLPEVLQRRAVAQPWVAKEDTFCLQVPAALVQALAADSAPFADFVHQRVLQ